LGLGPNGSESASSARAGLLFIRDIIVPEGWLRLSTVRMAAGRNVEQ
jgi:hypothetical protein